MSIHFIVEGVLVSCLVIRSLTIRSLERIIDRHRAQHESDQQTLTEWRARWARFEEDPRTHTGEPS